MNLIADWVRKIRLGNRPRRVELLGGHPASEPEIAVESFAPDLREDERLEEVRTRTTWLGAPSFDEATGNALVRYIVAQGTYWEEFLGKQHQQYLARATQRLNETYGTALQYRQMLEEDVTRLNHAEMAMEAAVLALAGGDPEYAELHQAPITIRTASLSSEPLSPSGPEDASPDEPRCDGVASDPEDTGFDGEEATADREEVTAWPLGAGAPLRPQLLSRGEIGRLLAPRDVNRRPRWAEPGFRNGTLLAGRPVGAFIHALVLLVAAGADIGAFTQTVELVLPQNGYFALVVVAGLTAVVLYLAHMAGAFLREASALRHAARGASGRIGQTRSQRTGRHLPGRIWRGVAMIAIAAIWLTVGVLAFWVRYTVPLPTVASIGGCSSGVLGQGATSGCAPTDHHVVQAAAIFLGLYLATGVVAAIGAYVTHNPGRGEYAKAIRSYRKASERWSGSVNRFARALAAHQRQQAEIDASKQVLASAKAQNTALTERLKQEALIQIASLLKDPAVTDAFFPPGP